MTATLLACLVVVVEVVMQKGNHDPPLFPAPTFNSFFLGFGAILFGLGGASLFPTIQNDMKNRAQFPESVVITFLGRYVLGEGLGEEEWREEELGKVIYVMGRDVEKKNKGEGYLR